MRRTHAPGVARTLAVGLTLASCVIVGGQTLTIAKTKAPKPSELQPAKPEQPLAQTPAKETKLSDDTVARIGSTDVSAAEVKTFVASLGAREKAALAGNPALLSQLVRNLLANRLVLQQAREKKWDQKPEIAAQLERVRDNTIVESYLQAVSTPPASFPSESDVVKVYEANRSALLVPRQYEVAQIFVPVPQGADPEAEAKAKQKADEIYSKAKAPGVDFGAVARDNGTANDGKLGWLKEADIRPEIRASLKGLERGAVADPIKLDDGWHILKLTDTRAAYTAGLPEVHDQLVQQIRNERATAIRRAFLAEMLKKDPPILNELALSNLVNDQASAPEK